MKVLNVYQVSSTEYTVESRFLFFWKTRRNAITYNDWLVWKDSHSFEPIPNEAEEAIYDKFMRTTIPWADKTTIISEKIVTTRKDYDCHGCGAHIPKGKDTTCITCVEHKALMRAYLCDGCMEYLGTVDAGEYEDGIMQGALKGKWENQNDSI